MRGEGKNVKLLVCLWRCNIRRLVGSRRAQRWAVAQTRDFILYTPKSEWQAAKRLHISIKTFQSFHTCTVYDHDIMKNGKFHTISIPICLNKTVSITFTTISIYVEALMTRSHVLNGIIKWCNKIRIKMASSVTTLFPQLAVYIRVLQFSNWLYGISCLQTPSTSNLYFHTYTHTHNKYISPW